MYDVIEELRRLSLSKYFPALCHKLIYDFIIFYSINGKKHALKLHTNQILHIQCVKRLTAHRNYCQLWPMHNTL